MSFPLLRTAIGLLLILASVTTQGCSDPLPAKVLRLEVDAAGTYKLEDRVLTADELKVALAAAKRASPIELEVCALPNSDYQRVGQAVELAQSLEIARIRFVQHGAPPQSRGASAQR